MPLPTAWHPVSHVDGTRDQGFDPVPCAHPQVGRCFGAVSLRTGKFIRSLCATFNAATFETFLKTLLRHRSATRAWCWYWTMPGTNAVLLKPLLRRYRAVLTLLFLPPYSPQLAPVERVWKLARRLATHNRFFVTLDDVLTAVATCFDRWRKPNSVSEIMRHKLRRYV